MASIEQITKDIETYLKSDPQKLNTFHKIISSINEDMNPDQIYDQIIELIQENEQLLDTFTQGAENVDISVDAFAELYSFIQAVDVNANNKSDVELFAQFSHVISLFTNELITIQFFEERIRELTTKLSSSKSRRSIEQVLKSLVSKIHTSNQQLFFQTIRQTFIKEIKDDFIVDTDYTPSILVQILVMTGCICSVDQMNVVLRALKLYSQNLIPIEGIYRWIESVNLTIAQAFDEASQTENIESFYPYSIFETMTKELKTSQIKWCLGEKLYSILSENEKSDEKPQSFLNLAIKYKKEYIKQKDRNEAATMPYIAELQCIKMFKILTIMSDFYRSDSYNQQPKIPSYLTDLIFGPGKFEQDEAYYSVLIEKCLSFGAKSNMAECHFMDQRLGNYIPSSNDWRVAFHEKLQKRFLVHTLFFTGKTFEIKNEEEEAENFDVLKETSDIAKEFSTKFTKLNPNAIGAFLKMFERGGDFDLLEDGAVAVACFMEMLEMVDDVLYSGQEDKASTPLSKIPEKVWDEASPLISFDGFSIANIDIALKYFIRSLNKAYNQLPEQFEKNKYSFPPAGIAYHLVVKDNKYEIKGYINPAFD